MGSPLNKITAALFQGSQETTLALAAVNVDFSLFKVEAPIEYQALGSCLSKERRHLAEDGTQHMTARRLGALFRSKIPKVPHLIRAYGERVSEIAVSTSAAATATPASGRGGGGGGGSGNVSHSVFSGHVGIDGTAIWAAATAGPEAICLQLLACMLARFWSPKEAVSIWAEITEARKKELLLQRDDIGLAEMAAVQANVAREQLAEWDASARAWLATADMVKARQQTQLRLILSNLDVVVNSTEHTYESVMEAWIESMKVVNNLLAGMPQSIHHGAALVGLSAWHLYPDMMLYVDAFKEVAQADPLFGPGGILTIGLQSTQGGDHGVCWSLPLAKLRYYGDPVLVTKVLNEDDSRVSFQQLILIVIGILARQWPDMRDKYERICGYWSWVWKQAKTMHSSSWISALGEAADLYLEATGEEKRRSRRLVDFGHRREHNFMNSHEPIALSVQLFLLDRPHTFLRALSKVPGKHGSTTHEHKVELMRSLLVEHFPGARPEDWIIVSVDKETVQYATALAAEGPRSAVIEQRYHCVWSITATNAGWASMTSTKFQIPTSVNVAGDCPGAGRENRGETVVSCADAGWARKFGENQGVLTFKSSRNCGHGTSEFSYRYPSAVLNASSTRKRVLFDFAFGDPADAALYRRQTFGTHRTLPRSIDTMQILDAVEGDKLTLDFSKDSFDSEWSPLRALGTASDIYKSLGSASISTDFVSSSLPSMLWYQGISFTGPWWSSPPASQAVAFSCIIMMETGNQNLDPKQLQSVMAVSAGDSIYAAAELMSDPWSVASEVTRAHGNVGKPGVSLLIPPPRPRVRKPATNEWNVINHDEWDGRCQDSFENTSMHLLLTESRIPYAPESDGARDIQAFFQEAVVQVYDKDTWVGDVDLVKTLSGLPRTTWTVPAECPHGTVQSDCLRSKKPEKIVAIDNWFELLDRPAYPAVVRSTGNWIGRLAATGLCDQKGFRTLILPQTPCPQGCLSDINFVKNYLVKEGDMLIM